jgi:drug/metabolite transporter (DMT)-like permease
MSTQRILGIVLLVVGVAVLIYGVNASHSMADRMSDTFTGRFTEATTWYIIGGAASGLLGLLLVAFGGGRNRD